MRLNKLATDIKAESFLSYQNRTLRFAINLPSHALDFTRSKQAHLDVCPGGNAFFGFHLDNPGTGAISCCDLSAQGTAVCGVFEQHRLTSLIGFGDGIAQRSQHMMRNTRAEPRLLD